MVLKTRFLLTLIAVNMISLVGCSSQSTEDTAPLPKVDPQTRLDSATKNIEASQMTPEQKKAALDYLKSQAGNSQRMPQSSSPPPK